MTAASAGSSAGYVRRLARLIRNRRAKLGPMILASRRSGPGSRVLTGGGRQIPDRRDRYFVEDDAEQLFADGIEAWHGVRGLTRLDRDEFAFRRARASIEAVYLGLAVEAGWRRDAVPFSTLAAMAGGTSDGRGGDGWRDNDRPDDPVNPLPPGGRERDEWINYAESELAQRARLADAERRRRPDFEAALRTRLSPDEWVTWRGYRDLPLISLSHLTGIPLWTIQRRERRLVDQRARPLWREMFAEDLPADLARRRRHDMPPANSAVSHPY